MEMLTEIFSSVTTTGVTKVCYYMCYLSFQTDFLKHEVVSKGKNTSIWILRTWYCMWMTKL